MVISDMSPGTGDVYSTLPQNLNVDAPTELSDNHTNISFGKQSEDSFIEQFGIKNTYQVGMNPFLSFSSDNGDPFVLQDVKIRLILMKMQKILNKFKKYLNTLHKNVWMKWKH